MPCLQSRDKEGEVSSPFRPMKISKFAPILLFLFLIVLTPAFANNQGFETIDCTTKALKDTFSTSENVCIKETRVLPGSDCGDGGDTIQAYVLNYRTNYNTPDGSFFYTDGRSLSPYIKKSVVTINADRTIFYNLGTFISGSYDVAQGGNDYRGNDLYQGGCLDELGSPLVSAGFDIVAQQQQPGTEGFPCTSDQSCNTGLYCDKSQPLPNGLGICKQIQQQEGCLQVISPAYNPTTRECKTFFNSCLAEGWIGGSCPYGEQQGNLTVCPQLSAPPYCPDGKLISQGTDAQGCPLPPKCIVTFETGEDKFIIFTQKVSVLDLLKEQMKSPWFWIILIVSTILTIILMVRPLRKTIFKI